jgi:hypothetical protein
MMPLTTRLPVRFVEQMLYGIPVSTDVNLSRIGRALEESISLKKTEDRLSTNLNSEGLASMLHWRADTTTDLCWLLPPQHNLTIGFAVRRWRGSRSP